MTQAFTHDEAKALLARSSREQLVDHAFGDAEVYWYLEGQMIASGYFGRTASVDFEASEDHAATEFTGEQAHNLRYCGTLTKSERNDAGGSDL